MHQLYDALTNDQLVELLLEQLPAAQPNESQLLADVIDLQDFKEQRTRHAPAC